MSTDSRPEFPSHFDQVLNTADGSDAYFGRGVLAGLVDGIRAARDEQQARRSRWNWGVGVLGCAMWMDDPDLLAQLRECESVCVVVTKQAKGSRSMERLQSLQEFAK